MKEERKKELTGKQAEVLRVYIESGSENATGAQLGISRSTVRSHFKAIRDKGHEIPKNKQNSGFKFATSTLIDGATGETRLQWVKEKFTEEKQAVEEFVDGLCSKVSGRGVAPKRRPRKSDTDDLLFELDIFDPHIGMFADEKETLGSNYNCQIASQRMMDAVHELCSRVAHLRPKKCVLVFGGDLLHSDFRSNKTEQSGNQLDVDSRYDRVQDYAIEMCTNAVRVAATTAEMVDVVVVEGNHDWHSCKWMARVLNAFFRNCENVNVRVVRSELKHMVWGNNLLCWAHGDKIKPQNWQGIISTVLAEPWGQTKHRYLRLGHIHHQKSFFPVQIDEQTGLLLEYLPALCPSDAWHASAGYVGSQKGASAFLYHKENGLRDRLYYNAP